jgi:hypothetical protein
MNAGSKISGNYASSGGGVFVASSGAFTMSGGEISGNIASGRSIGYGGGVYVNSNGTFAKQLGGAIYGSNADTALKNTSGVGHAVYVGSSPAKQRNTTAGENDVMYYNVTGKTDAGWE